MFGPPLRYRRGSVLRLRGHPGRSGELL